VEQLEWFFEQNNIEGIEHEHSNEWKIETRNGAEYKASTLQGALEQVPGITLLLGRPRTASWPVLTLGRYGPCFLPFLLLALPRLRRTLRPLLHGRRLGHSGQGDGVSGV
jgi:hypothetical protein